MAVLCGVTGMPAMQTVCEFDLYKFTSPYYFFMAALCNRAGHYIFALWFLSSIFLLFFLTFFSSQVKHVSSRQSEKIVKQQYLLHMSL